VEGEAVTPTMTLELERKLEYVKESQGKELDSLKAISQSIQDIMEKAAQQEVTQAMNLESQERKLESVRESQASQENKLDSLQAMLQQLLDRGKEASNS